MESLFNLCFSVDVGLPTISREMSNPPPTLMPCGSAPLAAPQLAEVPESAAPAAIAELYSDIRAVLGVRLVNLIYRHLATVPGALDWAWQALRPHFVSGALLEQAAALRVEAATTVERWALSTLPAPAGVAGLVATYGRANSLNLMALTHLLGLADTPGVPPPADASAQAASVVRDAFAAEELPPLPAWHSLSPEAQQRVLRLNRFGEPAEPQIVASLYRHLALWPDLLACLEPPLQRLQAEGVFAAARAAVEQAAARIAGREPLVIGASAPASVDAACQQRLHAFATLTLPKMVPVGLALQTAMENRPCT
jgi:hypothetical protein